MKKGNLIKFKEPFDQREEKERFILLKDPEGGRVLAEGVCNLTVRPTRILNSDDLELG